MNLTLIGVIIILLVFAAIGLKRGILRMLLPLVFAVATVTVMVFLTPEITKYISEATDWDEAVYTATEEYFEEEGLLLSEDSFKDTNLIPELLRENIDEVAGDYLEMGYASYNECIVSKVAGTIFSAVIMIVIFLAMLLIFVIIRIIVYAVGKIPVIRCVNRFAGMLVGILLGLLTVSLLCIVLMVFNNTEWAIAINKDISESAVLTFMYNHNLLLLTIAKIF